AAGKLVETLIRTHNIQIIIRHNSGNIQNLIEHLAVLGSDTDYAVQAASFRQCDYYRKHLNGVWAGHENCYQFCLCCCAVFREKFTTSVYLKIRIRQKRA